MTQNATNSAEGQTQETSGEGREPTQLEKLRDIMAGANQDNGEGRDLENASGDNAEDGDGDDQREGATDDRPTLKDLADRLGMEADKLYEVDIELGGDRGTMSLGELKDMAKDVGNIEVERLALAEEKARQDADMSRSMSELRELVGMLPEAAISQELLARVSQARAETEQREERAMLAAVKEWNDPKIRERDEGAMRAELAKYGLPEATLDNIQDHRVRMFIRDATLRAERIAEALKDVRTVRKAGHRSSHRTDRNTARGRVASKSARRDAAAKAGQILENAGLNLGD